MTITKINRKVDELGSAWEEFKQLNDRRLSEIERKGSADVLTVEHMNKMNNVMDAYTSKMNGFETTLNRPSFENGYNQKASSETILDHKNAFINYVRRGVEGELSYLEQKALSVGSDADGGYLVTPQINAEMAKYIFESSPMRQLASVTIISSDSLEIIEDNDEAGAAWTTDEDDAVTDSDSPQVGKITISAYELVAQPKATQKLIDDSSIDIEAWLTGKLVDVFSRKENAAFVAGDGSGKPKGIISYAAGTGASQIEQISYWDRGLGR